MPGLSLDLKITNLQQKNYNSLGLVVWDFANPSSGTTVTNFAIELKTGGCTIQWGNNKQTTSTSRTITANQTY